jgi:hypothetical protein
MFSVRATEAWGAPDAVQASYLLERRLDLAATTEPVYLGRERATGYRVWIKCSDGTTESATRLATEARILTGVRHPHILPLQADLSDRECACLLYPWQAEQPLSAVGLTEIPSADRVRLASDFVAAVHFLQTLDPAVAHGRLVLENLWLTPLVHWFRLTGFSHAAVEASAELLRSDRGAAANLLEDVLGLQTLAPALQQEVTHAAAAWVSGTDEALSDLTRALRRVLLASVTADL